MRKNINLLPSIYKNGEVVKKIMDILDVEFNDLRHHAETLGDQLNIKSVTWGADTWENELDIQYNPSISLDDRREIILAKVRGRGSTTKAMIKNTAESFSGGEVDVIEFPEENYFIIKFVGVRGIPSNMKAFTDVIETIKPAHLEYIFQYTYTTCQMLIDWGVTCNLANTMTCDELMVYEND